MRRYHHSPSIPFLIANAQCVQEPLGASLSASDSSGAISGPSDHSDASAGVKTALRVFLWSLMVAGFAIGGGLALELAGMMYQGLWTQAFGFLVAGAAIILKPEGE
jgi:hypothetical protein